MHESDLLVVARARGGDTEAFRALVERHSRYLFAVAHRLVGSVEDAQDVVQETWLKAHRQLVGFESRADVRTWLTRIAVNCAIDHIRGRRYRELSHDPVDLQQGPLSERAVVEAPAADRLLLGVEMQQRLASALTSLTALERGLHAAACRRVVDRRDRKRARPADERDEALYFPGGAQGAGGTRIVCRGMT